MAWVVAGYTIARVQMSISNEESGIVEQYFG